MRLSPRCFAVTGLAVLPPWCVNAGFVVGEHTTLVIDTGANAFAAATIYGYATTARQENRLVAINLEKHFDHIGGNSYLRERNIDIYGHWQLQRTAEEFCAEIAELNAAIPNAARRERGEAQDFYAGTRLANPNCWITEEGAISLGNTTAEVLFTPGHTATNLSVYVPEDGVLYCGDCLVNGFLPNLDEGTVTEWQRWIESIHKIARLHPRIVVPGHGHIVSGDEVHSLIDNGLTVLNRAIADRRSPTAL